MTNKISKKDEVAISVENVSKTFRIPHEKHRSLKSAALNIFKRRSYTELEALKNINLEIKKGEFFGIIGRNGSGKSTLLKILAGIYLPDSGRVTMIGKFSPFLELGVGFNPELTARENVYLGGSILGLSRREIAEKLEEIIKFAELEEFVDMKFKNFSSGMQVRLAFALSIFAHAEILLMDEVLAVGDSNFQIKCLKEFKNYKKLGKTVVLVTHDTGVVQRYCDRALLLEKGKVVKEGLPQIVCDSYIEKNIKDKELYGIYEKAEKQDSQGIKIIKTEVLNKDNKRNGLFRVGDTLKVKVKYQKKNKSIKGFNVNIAIRDSLDDRLLISYSTLADNFKIRNTGSILMTMSHIPLLRGSYYLNVSCFREDYEDKYDYKPKAARFTVTNKERAELFYNGSIYAEHFWEE